MNEETKTTIGTCKTCAHWDIPDAAFRVFIGVKAPPIEVHSCRFVSGFSEAKSTLPVMQVPPYFPDLPGVLPLATPEFFGCIWWTKQANQKGGDQSDLQ